MKFASDRFLILPKISIRTQEIILKTEKRINKSAVHQVLGKAV